MNASWRRYVRFWGARVDADVDDEIQFHIEMRTRDYIARGMSETDARREAQHRLGDVRSARDACVTIGHRRQRRMQRATTIDAFTQDVRYAVRTLGRQKGWTAIALLTLALGIGASTAVFSVVNSLLLHPIAYPHADRVGTLMRSDAKSGVSIGPSRQMVEAWQKNARLFDAIEPFRFEPAMLSGRGDAAQVQTARVQPTFFPFAGGRIVRGRAFGADEMASKARVAVLGESIWRERFGGSSSVLGQTIVLDDMPYTIVGVAANGLRLPGFQMLTPDVWLPLVNDTLAYSASAAVRLRKGVTPEAAGAELDTILAHAQIASGFGSRKFTTRIARPSDFVGFKSSLYILSGAVALLLIVACANVAHLLLARGATREREIAIRTALGAGRMRLARQLLTESLLLAAAGGALGVFVAWAAIKLLVMLKPESLASLGYVSLEQRALGAALATTIITGAVFGMTAALHAIRRTTSDSLRNTTLAGTGARGAHRLRSVLVATEMALSAMLLVGAALVVRSVVNLQHVDPGFDAANLYSTRLELARSPKDIKPLPGGFIDDAVRRLRGVPGVQAVAVAGSVPPESGFLIAQIEAQNSSFNKEAPGAIAMNNVEPNFFSTIGLRFVAGGTFSQGARDRGDVIINEGLARKLWPGQTAVGRHVRFPFAAGRDDPWRTVVGVVRDVTVMGLSGDRTRPLVYFPFNPAEAAFGLHFAVRVAPGTAPAAGIRTALGSLDSHLAPPKVQTVADALSESIASQRFTMLLLAAFASFAVLLSAIGLYGVISYVVTQRTREIGVRIALGATPRNVAQAIVARGLVLCAIGLVLGLVASVWGTRLISTMLYGVVGTDAVSYAATAFVLVAVSLAACLIPMRRAMRVDPVIAMRGD